MSQSTRSPLIGAGLLVAVATGLGCGAATRVDSTIESDSEQTTGQVAGDARPLNLRFESLAVTDAPDSALTEAARATVLADVRSRKSQQHGRLPPVARREAPSPDAWPSVSVRNDTPHGLVVWFAGPCPRTMALPPGGEMTDDLCEGEYDVAAELASEDFLPFVGESNAVESGYQYTLTFYVVASPQRRLGPRRR